MRQCHCRTYAKFRQVNTSMGIELGEFSRVSRKPPTVFMLVRQVRSTIQVRDFERLLSTLLSRTRRGKHNFLVSYFSAFTCTTAVCESSCKSWIFENFMPIPSSVFQALTCVCIISKVRYKVDGLRLIVVNFDRFFFFIVFSSWIAEYSM